MVFIDGDASATIEKENEAEEIRNTDVVEEKPVDIIKNERAEYDKLIKTRFKDFYTEDTQKMINRRFRKYKELEEKVREAEQTAVEAPKKLSDSEIFEEIKKSAEQIRGELAEKFLGLADDISGESKNFITLARFAVEEGKISLADAYKLSHFDDILSFEIERAIRETEERVNADIISRKKRPVENAARSRISGGAVNTARLTREERASLAKRAANGEKIRF